MKSVRGLALEPQEIRRLAETYRRACAGVRRREDREEIARALFDAYTRGIRDDDLLVHFAQARLKRIRGLRPTLDFAWVAV